MFGINYQKEKSNLERIFEAKDLYYIEHDIDRERTLETYLKYYLGLQYCNKISDWDQGMLDQGMDEAEIFNAGVSWDDALKNPQYFKKPAIKIPFKNRKPITQNNLATAIVERLTSLLFSDKYKPEIESISENEEIDEIIEDILKSTNFWQNMSLARNYGGSEGSVLIGWVIRNNKLSFEIEDARFVTPMFEGDVLKQIIIKNSCKEYYVCDDVNEYLIIANLKDEEMPNSKTEWIIQSTPHGFARIPWYYVNNTLILHSNDGLSDFNGQLGNFDAIDRINSELIIGVENNVDPSMVFKARDPNVAKRSELQVGSGTVIYCGTDEDLKFIEINGAGINVGRDLVKDIQENILQACRVTLEEPKAIGQTATEINQKSERVFEHVSALRTQYEKAIEYMVELALEYLGYTDNQVEVEWPKESKTIQDISTSADILVKFSDALGKLAAIGIDIKTEDTQKVIDKIIGELK